jgi:hypothetical protein
MDAMTPAVKRQLVTVNARTFTRRCLRDNKRIVTLATYQYTVVWPCDNFHKNILRGGETLRGSHDPFSWDFWHTSFKTPRTINQLTLEEKGSVKLATQDERFSFIHRISR